MTRPNDVEYFRVHNWLSYHYGKANCCENKLCASVSPKRFEWALIKGENIARIRNNFIMLCPSCHRKYDYTNQQRGKISFSKTGKAAANKIAVYQFDLNGVFIKKHSSYVEAASAVGGVTSAFCALKRGRLKTYKSFLWQF